MRYWNQAIKVVMKVYIRLSGALKTHKRLVIIFLRVNIQLGPWKIYNLTTQYLKFSLHTLVLNVMGLIQFSPFSLFCNE